MNKSKKIYTLFLSLILFVTICVPVKAADDNNTITYTIYNENGEFIEDGMISKNDNTRATWTADVELQSGYYVNFKSNSNAFYLNSGRQMTLTYTLNKSATISCRFIKTSSATGSGTVWSSTTKIGSSGSVSKTADSNSYYYPRISNTGSNMITITNVTFTY